MWPAVPALGHRTLRVSPGGIPAVLIQGNHDALLGPRPLTVRVFGPRDRCWSAGGADLPQRRGSDPRDGLHRDSLWSRACARFYPGPETGRWNIGLMHTSARRCAGHDPYCALRTGRLWCATVRLLGRSGIFTTRPAHRGPKEPLRVMPGIPPKKWPQASANGWPARATLVEIDLQGGAPTRGALETCAVYRRVCSGILSGVADQAGRRPNAGARGAGGGRWGATS